MALRKRLFKNEPLCRACRAKRRITLAVIRDHVIPLSQGGTDTEDNVQPLCQECSDRKTAGEGHAARHGRAKAMPA